MPITVVVDASVLIQDFRLTSPKSRLLLDVAEREGFELVVPEVVVRETVGNFKDELEKSHEAATKAKRRLAYLIDLDVAPVPLTIAEHVNHYDTELRTKLEEAGAEVPPIWPVSHDDLVNRAVGRVPPFAEKDRGFRDTLIWHEVLARSRLSQVIFLTADTRDFVDKRGEGTTLRRELREELDEWRPVRDGFWLVRGIDELEAAIEEATGVEDTRRSDPVLDRFRERLADEAFKEALTSKIVEHIAWSFPTVVPLGSFRELQAVSVESASHVHVEPLWAHWLEDSQVVIQAHVHVELELVFTILRPLTVFFAGWDPAEEGVTALAPDSLKHSVSGTLMRTFKMTFDFIYDSEREEVTEVDLEDEGFAYL